MLLAILRLLHYYWAAATLILSNTTATAVAAILDKFNMATTKMKINIMASYVGACGTM